MLTLYRIENKINRNVAFSIPVLRAEFQGDETRHS